MLSWVCSGNAFAASLDNLLRAWKERSVLQAGQHIFRYGLKSYPFALGLVVVQAEGSAVDAVLAADIVVTDQVIRITVTQFHYGHKI
jgi:hypothetical protein